MARINVMDVSLADKIAAGEVVERPASVVKELVENSIDANASKIDIIIQDGGRSLIEVIDNGCGMNEEDAKLSILRHATSKIHIDQDLFSINTMGFRGEALAAICAVSVFSMVTKDENSNLGTRITVTNSNITEIKKIAANRGTTIKVSELFYNTPARLKYLKNDNYELALISDIINKLAMANPNISFTLIANDRQLLKTSGNGDIKAIIGAIYGLDVVKAMVPFEIKNADFKICGYTSKIAISKANKYAIHTFVNKRLIRNKFLTDAIIDGYHEMLFENRFPYTLLYVETSPMLLDVNVHPTKQEIRISKDNDLKELITKGIKESLISHDEVIINPIKKQTFLDLELREDDEPAGDQLSLEIEPTILKQYEVIGQVHGTYIIAQSKDGFILVDQHAAQERINYEKYKQDFKNPVSMEQLLVPIIKELPVNEFLYVMENKEKLGKVFLSVEEFGTNSIKISEIPHFFKHVDIDTYIDECIHQLVSNKKINDETLIDNATATLACKASLKGNTALSLLEMEELIENLFKCNDPYTCPHGRPTMISYSKYELEKFFKRS